MTNSSGRAGLRRAVVAAIAAATALLVAGCGADDESAASSSSSGAAFDAVMPPQAFESAAGSASSDSGGVGGAEAPQTAGGGAPGDGPLATDNRQIVRTADLQIALHVGADVPAEDVEKAQRDAVDAAVAAVRSQALGQNGFVADLQQTATSASMVIRVPAANYETFRTMASDNQDVLSSTESASDVTGEYTDVASRIETMQASIDRLRALIAGATSITDIITVEAELTAREAELESLQGRLAVLADQVSLATISVTYTAIWDGTGATATTEPADKANFFDGLSAGWTAFVDFFRGAGTVIGSLLPFLPLLLLFGFGIRWLVRRNAANDRARAAAASSMPPYAFRGAPTMSGEPPAQPAGAPMPVGAGPADSPRGPSS